MRRASTAGSRVSGGTPGASPVVIERWTASDVDALDDWIAIEEPLEVRVRHPGGRGSSVSLTMRTPGRDCELAVGFLHGEGLLTRREEVIDVESCVKAPNVVNVTLDPGVAIDRIVGTRGFYMTSSCGLCGKRSLYTVIEGLRGRRVLGDGTVGRSVLASLPDRVRRTQATFDRTGGLHGAALLTLDGELVDVAEDVGRHNAVDKVIGAAWLARALPATDRILFLSGRAGFELLQKAAFAGISIVAAVGAPSSLAVELARDAGMTLIGFLGPSRFNVYSGSRRIDG